MIRRLTIEAETRDPDPVGVPPSYYPKLRLRGRWLERAGFRPGDRITVEVASGQLIIRPERTELAHDNRRATPWANTT